MKHETYATEGADRRRPRASRPDGHDRGKESAASTAKPLLTDEGEVRVRLLGEYVVGQRTEVDGTLVGGLSGIDRDARTGEWVLISDDRGRNPARFYSAKIDLDARGVHNVQFTAAHLLLQPDGTPYPPYSPDERTVVDPEEIRVDPQTGERWWSQEGNRPKSGSSGATVQPAIQRMTPDGRYLGDIQMPANYAITTARGPNRNLTIEAFAFGAGGEMFVTAIEGSLLQDGPLSSVEHGSLSRVTVHSRTGQVVAQYAYPQEPLFAAAPAGGQADHGVASVLVHPEDPARLLMLERTFVTDRGFKIRLFEASTRGATDVRHIESLAGADIAAMPKRLVLDFDELALPRLDNLEGMSWGPRLPTGEHSLLLVSDDNFHPLEITQFVGLALTWRR
jgi:3-phytase